MPAGKGSGGVHEPPTEQLVPGRRQWPFVCPNNPDGRCFVDERGRPICAEPVECVDCRNDADCREITDIAAAKCIKRCRNCNADTNGRACVILLGSARGAGA